jgi:hypothetical protein
MFNHSPSEKLAIAYNCVYTNGGDSFCLVTVNSVINGKVIKYLYSEDKVTSISCPDEQLVICGTE